MRILFLSFYFSPDLCAGSFRNSALLEKLANKMPAGFHIDVVTTLPNRYAEFSVNALSVESGINYTVHRIQLPSHQSGMVDQSSAFVKFAIEAFFISRRHKYDLVYASSSRLMTASLGALIARFRSVPLYLDIRDIFVDTLKDVLPSRLVLILQPVFSIIEKWAFKRATTINLVSEGFKPYFEARYPGKNLTIFTNGIDKEFTETAGITPINSENKSIISVLYAGNVGEGQGLHKIIPQIAVRLKHRIRFKIIGDGGLFKKLKDSISDLGADNVDLVPPMDRQCLIKEYVKADVLFLHLNDYPAFEKVLPSKLFEYAAMNKPIWAGLGGYSSKFVKSEISDCALFAPANIDDAIKKFDDLNFSIEPRVEFIRKFNREKIMNEMAMDILGVINDA